MLHTKRNRYVAAAVGLLLGSIATGWVSITAAQSLKYGRTTISIPERDDAGHWEGTWFYVSRHRKMALWFDEQPEKLGVRFQMLDTDRVSDSFITDWDARASYRVAGHPGTFAMEFDHIDANTITGAWDWKLGSDTASRHEKFKFTMYRSGNRQMAFVIEDLERIHTGKYEETVRADQQVWMFHKASNRHALWEELPF